MIMEEWEHELERLKHRLGTCELRRGRLPGTIVSEVVDHVEPRSGRLDTAVRGSGAAEVMLASS